MTGKLRLLFGVAILLVAVQPMFAQDDFRQWDPADGIPLRQGYHIEWFRSADTDANGNMCIVWSDARLGDRAVWAQLLDADGNPQWGEDGILVANDVSRQEDPHVISDGQGNWIVTWIDFRDDILVQDVGDIYAQKLDSNGATQWLESGVPICVDDEQQLWQQSFLDGAGGVVIIWVDNRSSQADIYGQRLSGDGVTLWADNGIMLAGGTGDQGSISGADYTADTDGMGGMVFAYRDQTNPSDPNVRMNRVDVDGNLLWAGTNGISICNVPGDQKRIRLAPDGNSGAFLVWEDTRNSATSGSDLYGQHVLSDGSMSWATNGVEVCAQTADQSNPRIVASADGEAVVVWDDKRGDSLTNDLYTQRISDTDGSITFHWGPAGNEQEGMLLVQENLNQSDARLYPDGLGGAVYSWMDERSGAQPNNDLYAQRVTVDGEKVWGDANGIAVSDAASKQEGNLVRRLDDNSVSVLWFDYRQGSPGLYYQLYDFAGNEQMQHNGNLVIYGIDGNGTKPWVVPAEDPYAYVGWTDGRWTILGTYAYAQKVNRITGETVWTRNGVSLTPGFPFSPSDTTSVHFEDLRFASDGQNGIVAVWSDTHVDATSYIYAQRMDASGNVLWGDRGTPVSYSLGQSNSEQLYPLILEAGDGGVYTFYIQYTEDYYQTVFGQRLNANGEPQWFEGDVPGKNIATMDADLHIQSVCHFSDGSILVVMWLNDEFNGNNDIYAQRISPAGELMWDEPLAVCTAPQLQTAAKTVQVDGGVVVLWEDNRASTSGTVTDIYGQMVHPDGTVGWDVGGVSLVAEPNQQQEIVAQAFSPRADNFWIAFKDGRDGIKDDIGLQRFNLDGEPQLGTDPIWVGLDDHRQVNPQILVDIDNGLFVTWEESDRSVHEDLMFAHVREDGSLADAAYEGEGEVLTEAVHRQQYVSMSADSRQGFFAAWEDARSTGKDVLSNIYMQDVLDNTVGVEEHAANQPAGWALHAAYPNPFNPSTLISFDVPRNAQVKLAVYDVLGREVARLVDGSLRAGSHQVVWNGRNMANSPVASGTYFYRLEANGMHLTRSFVLMK